jgi:hypothetical protein
MPDLIKDNLYLATAAHAREADHAAQVCRYERATLEALKTGLSVLFGVVAPAEW